ncbi:tyrosine-type recombinase/integrase [Xanthobacter sp. V3C-4]|uniref:tyrosine-type recombinase/integrase n=3 Tax=Xanthobacter autotrophicus (strain ATCC BAA-1158 / Py2) TaxID=78245 RepID=UPI003728886E
MAERFRITKRTVDSLPAVDSPKVFYDSTLPGFGIRVMPSGAKAFVVEYRPGGGGRGVAKRRMKLGTYGEITPEQARDLARDALADVRRGEDPAGARAAERAAPTVAEMAERWLAEEVRPKKKPKTAAGYAALMANHVIPALGSRKAAGITEADVARLHRRVGATARIAANRAVAALSAAFTWAQRARIVPKGHNPCQGLDRFRETRRETFLSGQQLERLGAAIREAETVGIPWEPDPAGKVKHAPKAANRRVRIAPHAAAALRLLIFTGARLGEILNLRWEHVDFERGLLLLPDSKTGKKAIVLNAPALAILAELPRMGAYAIAGEDPKKPRSDLKAPWAAVARRAGFMESVEKIGEDGKLLKDRAGRPVLEERATVRLHDLRHTHASVGAGAGLGLQMIGKLLGHTQAATTQRYAHLADDPLRAASETIGARLAAAMGEGAASSGGAVVPMRRKVGDG